MATQQPVELILLRQWAAYLALPIWIMSADGELLFYNEAAEPLIGRRYEDSGPIQSDQLAELFQTQELDGSPLANEDLPLVAALVRERPAHRRLRFKGHDEHWRSVEVTAWPITGQAGTMLGVAALFWEASWQ